MKKNNVNNQSTETKERYRVVKSASESSLGYWIIPLAAILIIGLAYIVTTLFIKADFNFSFTANKTTAKDISFDIFDLNNNRSRVGEPINLDETRWSRSDPLAPAE